MESALAPIFRGVIRLRWLIVAIYLAALGPAIYFSLRVTQDNSVDRLVVPSDPDSIKTRKFQEVFGKAEYVILVAEAPDPFAPEVLKTLDALEQKLAQLPKVETGSPLSVFRKTRGRFTATPEEAEAFKRFATGTDMFRKQGSVGDGYLCIPVILQVSSTQERQQLVATLDAALVAIERSPAPLTSLRKVGQSYVNAYLDSDTRNTGVRSFTIFAVFVFVLIFSLYRSIRTLIAFLISLG